MTNSVRECFALGDLRPSNAAKGCPVYPLPCAPPVVPIRHMPCMHIRRQSQCKTKVKKKNIDLHTLLSLHNLMMNGTRFIQNNDNVANECTSTCMHKYIYNSQNKLNIPGCRHSIYKRNGESQNKTKPEVDLLSKYLSWIMLTVMYRSFI